MIEIDPQLAGRKNKVSSLHPFISVYTDYLDDAEMGEKKPQPVPSEE